ncbi:hypothetical protein BC936DRAFT_147728 [Jimgerdemannia flammicorona]|uniref:Uncharacterized protein n=2 Tax=Jimgerdemannia flammicorona TaxID=994334 RepID=A0A433D4M4_9FUNG|nr:hypothetical protein BC936DRAFT_147728 [Jimgerdemannia flammicorona]RUS31549.1 hypothetical protein BC938DRAFT_477579 [Jimgerdemannia flammicorona]
MPGDLRPDEEQHAQEGRSSLVYLIRRRLDLFQNPSQRHGLPGHASHQGPNYRPRQDDPRSTASLGIKDPPVDNLIARGLTTDPVFGVFLGKEASLVGGGEYVFGGYNKDKVGGTLTTITVDNSQGF